MRALPASRILLTLGLVSCASTGVETQSPRTPGKQVADGAAVAKQVLGDDGGWAWPVEYEWLTAGRVYDVRHHASGHDLLVAVLGDGGPVVRLTGDEGALKHFLAMQFGGRLPDVDALIGIAELLKDVVVGRSGIIATPELFESARRDGLDEWLAGRERDPAVLATLCSGIQRSLDENVWILAFNVINGWGGVDRVRVSGTASPLRLVRVSVGVLKARGEFSYPLSGGGGRG